MSQNAASKMLGRVLNTRWKTGERSWAILRVHHGELLELRNWVINPKQPVQLNSSNKKTAPNATLFSWNLKHKSKTEQWKTWSTLS